MSWQCMLAIDAKDYIGKNRFVIAWHRDNDEPHVLAGAASNTHGMFFDVYTCQNVALKDYSYFMSFQPPHDGEPEQPAPQAGVGGEGADA